MSYIKFGLMAALALAVTPASSHDYTIGEISVIHPFTYETAKTARTAAGYFTFQMTETPLNA